MKDTITSAEMIESIKSSLSKRARIVVDHILKHGFITTEELEKEYGYNHPPRAARDVREGGIPLETFKIESSTGKKIAAYRLGDLTKINEDKLGGRKVIPKNFKNQLYERNDGCCYICNGKFHKRYLQVDHRIPYEISGDPDVSNRDVSEYMLLCSSCNRKKSWSCEHCQNWLKEKSTKVCLGCYWTSPENYDHIALQDIRRIDLIWRGKDVEIFDKLRTIAKESNQSIQKIIIKIIIKFLKKSN